MHKKSILIKTKGLVRKIQYAGTNFFLMLYYLPLEVIRYHFNAAARNSVRILFTNFWPIVSRPWLPVFKYLQTFKNSKMPCEIVKYYKPDIQYFNVFGNKNKIIKSKTRYKIFFSMENLNNYPDYLDNCVDLVSLSITTSLKNQEPLQNYFRMANWLYYFFCPLDSKDIIKNKLSGFKKKYNKSKFCTLIARHDITNMRKPIYDLVSTIDAVECPSNFLHNDDSLHKQYNNDKKKYLQQYKFNICPENSINPGYVSEKPFEALYSGCIPIYTGWNRDFEPGIINPNIVMFFEPDSDNTALVQEIKRLHENERLYKAFMAQEYFMDTAVDKIYAMLQIYNEKISEIVEKCIKEKEYGKIS